MLIVVLGQVLVDCGGDVNAVDKQGNTPLHSICSDPKSLETASELIQQLVCVCVCVCVFISLRSYLPTDICWSRCDTDQQQGNSSNSHPHSSRTETSTSLPFPSGVAGYPLCCCNRAAGGVCGSVQLHSTAGGAQWWRGRRGGPGEEEMTTITRYMYFQLHVHEN